MRHPEPWYVWKGTAEDFFLEMLELGVPLETSLVGVFASEGRGSRRDLDLPLHQDGVYSEELTKSQGGVFVQKYDIDLVGLYCLRGSDQPCITLVEEHEIDLKPGQALILDNRKVRHGRRGPVGQRLLIRLWLKLAADQPDASQDRP